MGATMFGATSLQPREVSTKRRTENLAYIYQQILTVIVRVRQNRQAVSDANAFRANIQAGLRAAEKDAVKKAYSPDDIRMATLAAVAYLDESIRQSSNPVFSSWHSMPLQEEMFGHHVAGETFFENLEKLMSRQDSNDAADVLEVYALCLLMGYKGRYGLSSLTSSSRDPSSIPLWKKSAESADLLWGSRLPGRFPKAEPWLRSAIPGFGVWRL